MALFCTTRPGGLCHIARDKNHALVSRSLFHGKRLPHVAGGTPYGPGIMGRQEALHWQVAYEASFSSAHYLWQLLNLLVARSEEPNH